MNFLSVFGTILCASGLAMLVYRRLRPDRRGRVVLTGAAAQLLTGALWISSGVAADAPQPVQDLLGALRALPYELALTYVCYLVVRSVGKNHPRTERLLATGVYVLPCLPLVLGVVAALYFPQPAIDSTTPGTVALFVPRIRNLVEVGYLTLITSVFVRETFRNSTPLLRAQNGALSLAGTFLLVAIATNFPITAVRIMIPNRQDLTHALGELHGIQLGSMVLFGVGLMVGIMLYYSAEEREELLQRCRAWIRHRHEIEAAAYDLFGSGLGYSRSGARAAAYYHRAAATLGLGHRRREQGRLTIVLLALMLDPRYENLVSEVEDAQHQLLGSPEFAALSMSRLGGRIQYDIRDDDLYMVLGPARRLAEAARNPDRSANPTPGRLVPEWLQLAAAFSADIGFLPHPARETILQGHGPYASTRVVSCYQAAKRTEAGLPS